MQPDEISLRIESGAPSVAKMALILLKRMFDKRPQSTKYEKLLSNPELQKPGDIRDWRLGCRYLRDESHDKQNTKDRWFQICPHETQSFRRMKRIVHLLSIKYSGDKIDAFTNAAGPHHVLSEAGTHLSKAYPVRFSSLKANSFYEYQQGYEENYDGLLLCIHWTMNFHVHMDIAGSVSDLQIRLDTLDIHGCRHATLGDLRIVAKSYRL